MASAIVLDGPATPTPTRSRRSASLGSVASDDGCRCSVKVNSRTGKRTRLCPVPQSKKHRSGWTITGSCDR